MDSIRLKARAKINLGLDVTGIREDGYHEVKMVMQTVGLYDRIIIEKTKEPGIVITSNLSYIPLNENNLMYKAADMLMREFDIDEGVHMDLRKFIPVAAGMAGGSSDAAAVFYGMNRMFGLGLDIEQLKERAVKVGADVPYCLIRGTMLATGIGEKLDRLPPMPQCAIVVAKPPVNVSTRMVYEKLDMSSDIRHPDIDAVIRGLENGDLVQIAESMGNVLEDVTIPMHPVIDTIKRDMKRFGAINAMMSGSGPTVFGIFDDKQQAQICLNHMREQGSARQAYITDVYNVRQI